MFHFLEFVGNLGNLGFSLFHVSSWASYAESLLNHSPLSLGDDFFFLIL